MTEPRIQYAKTEDGVNIAYWTFGEGDPLVVGPWEFSHAELFWRVPELRRIYERLAGCRRLVSYDGRGAGLSDREVRDYSLDASVLELEAVVKHLELKSFALMGIAWSGMPAIVYAARHPERVTRLILLGCYARPSHVLGTSAFQALRSLVDADWELFTETFAHYFYGLDEGQAAKRIAAYIRECVTQQAYQAMLSQRRDTDVSDLLPQISCPTLVIHPRKIRFIATDAARRLASGIPRARLVVVEEQTVVTDDVWDPVVAAIDEFLGEGEDATAKSELPEGMAVILFADIADSTALTEKLGDAAFREKARELDKALRSVIRECSGTPVEGKLVGDGVLTVFTSARQAIECALRCNGAGESVGLQLHLGIHAGDVIREGNNVYGGAVNIAARVAGASEPGEVLVSDTVRGLARTSAGVAFENRGERDLKGVGEPVRLFAVRGEPDD